LRYIRKSRSVCWESGKGGCFRLERGLVWWFERNEQYVDRRTFSGDEGGEEGHGAMVKAAGGGCWMSG